MECLLHASTLLGNGETEWNKICSLSSRAGGRVGTQLHYNVIKSGNREL